MTKADYASTEPYMIALKKKRAELTYLIYSLIEKVEDFCASIRISTATFYKVQRMEYVTGETWSKLKNGFIQICTKEEYLEFMSAYDALEYDAFEGR